MAVLFSKFSSLLILTKYYGLRLQNFRLLKDGSCKILQGNGSNGMQLSHDKLSVVIYCLLAGVQG